MPSAKDVQDSILREVGAGLEGMPDQVLSAALDLVTPYIGTYWEMYAAYALIRPRLQALYVKKHCINVLLGQVRDLIQVNVGSASVSQSQLSDNLHKLYDRVDKEIQAEKAEGLASRMPAMGTINNPVTQDGLYRFYRTDRPLTPWGWATPSPPANTPWNP